MYQLYYKFAKLLRNQFENAAQNKYQLNEDKEMTDLICEFTPGISGIDWILSTIFKYLGRIKNNRQEKDFLKIGTYIYIGWLKMGFHLNENHNEDLDSKFKSEKEEI